MDDLMKSVDSSLLGQCFLTKEGTKHLLSLGQQSINKVANLINVQKMLTIDSQQLQQAANKQTSHCTCSQY